MNKPGGIHQFIKKTFQSLRNSVGDIGSLFILRDNDDPQRGRFIEYQQYVSLYMTPAIYSDFINDLYELMSSYPAKDDIYHSQTMCHLDKKAFVNKRDIFNNQFSALNNHNFDILNRLYRTYAQYIDIHQSRTITYYLARIKNILANDEYDFYEHDEYKHIESFFDRIYTHHGDIIFNQSIINNDKGFSPIKKSIT